MTAKGVRKYATEVDFAEAARSRFWSLVPHCGDSCWEWAGATLVNGYGNFMWFGRRPRVAHRIAYYLTHGAIPAGMQVLHSCDNKRCVRPDHLRLGTQADNMRDAVERKRLPKTRLTHCVRGHPFVGENLRVGKGIHAGHRTCRECTRMRSRIAWRNRSKAS